MPVTETGLFDVDPLRGLGRKMVRLRGVEQPTLVLGSTQDDRLVDWDAADRLGVTVARRRSGGGAVLLEPRSALWVDTWVPRGDPLFEEDVSRSPLWIGEWWRSALGTDGLEVHQGPSIETRWSRQLCFAGLGPGEVASSRRKLVGVAQWRSREGVLSHAIAYLGVDWARTVGLLRLDGAPAEATRALAATTVTLGEVGVEDVGAFGWALLERLPDRPSWQIGPPG